MFIFTYVLHKGQTMSSEEWNEWVEDVFLSDVMYMEYNMKISSYSVYYEANEGGEVVENPVYSSRIYVGEDIIFKILHFLFVNNVDIKDGKENIV